MVVAPNYKITLKKWKEAVNKALSEAIDDYAVWYEAQSFGYTCDSVATMTINLRVIYGKENLKDSAKIAGIRKRVMDAMETAYSIEGKTGYCYHCLRQFEYLWLELTIPLY